MEFLTNRGTQLIHLKWSPWDATDTLEAVTLGRKWYNFLTAGRNSYIPPPRTNLRIALKGTVRRTAKPHFSRGVTCSTSDTGMFGYIAVHQSRSALHYYGRFPLKHPVYRCRISIPPPLIRLWHHSPYTPSQPWKLLRYESSRVYETHAQWSATRRQFVKSLANKSCIRPLAKRFVRI